MKVNSKNNNIETKQGSILHVDNETAESTNGLDNSNSCDSTSINSMLNDSEEEYDDSNNEDNRKSDKLNISRIFRILKHSWWMLALNCLIMGSISALLIVEDPRIYSSSVMLAPETENTSTGGTLSSLASSFGIDLGGVNSSDAIRPDLYPDLVASNDFILKVLKIPVKTLDGNVYTDYYTYLKKYQKGAWWRKAIRDFMKQFKKKPPVRNKSTIAQVDGTSVSDEPSRILTYDEEQLIEGVRSSVVCSVDKRTFIININVTGQDPLVCATVADSVRSMIQTFVTEYRTKKASKDYNYYFNLLKQAKEDYETACKQYAEYVDTHRDVILQSYMTERDQLENNMQLKLNTYNAMINQTQAAKAKIQERTPAFTVLQHAYVPVMPIGPKRMLFVLGMVFMTFFITSLFLVVKEI